MQISTINILGNGDWYEKYDYCHKVGDHVLAFDLQVHIWPWPILKVKVMHISTAHILEMVTDR